MKEVSISKEPIGLHKLLKFINAATSGGDAKHVIGQGRVRVNGEVETRKHKKIFAGDIVEVAGLRWIVRVVEENRTPFQ